MALTLDPNIKKLAPPLLVNSDLKTLPLNQALTEFTRRATVSLFGKADIGFKDINGTIDVTSAAGPGVIRLGNNLRNVTLNLQ